MKISRAPFVFALLPLLMTSCSKEMDPATEAGNSLAPGSVAQPQFMADPGTALAVAGAVLDVAVKLKSLFGRSDDGRETRRQLAVIQAQNAEIINRLGQVLDILNNLGVIVQRSVREELLTHIRTTLGSNFQLYYETRAAEMEDPRSRSTAYQRYERDILPAIRPLARQIANREVYGFAHFNAVGHSMFIETWIARRLREPVAFRKQSGQFYKAYFGQVLDPTIAGSVGQRLAASIAQRDRLSTILDQADAVVASGRTWTATEVTRRTRCRGGERTTLIDVTRVVRGDRTAGYSVVEVSRGNQRNEDTCDYDGPRCRQCLALTDLSDPVDTGDQSAAGRADYWNAVRQVHSQVAGDVEVLSKTAETAKVYLEQADQLAVRG